MGSKRKPQPKSIEPGQKRQNENAPPRIVWDAAPTAAEQLNRVRGVLDKMKTSRNLPAKPSDPRLIPLWERYAAFEPEITKRLEDVLNNKPVDPNTLIIPADLKEMLKSCPPELKREANGWILNRLILWKDACINAQQFLNARS